MHISMSSPDITQAEIDAVNEVLRTPYLSIGPKLIQFEEAFAQYVGTKYAVAVNSGTSGLHPAVIASGVQAGDEVITPSFSFVASANCIVYERARPVDIDPIRLVAQKHKLIVIEDACEAIGAEYKGRRAGTLADVGVFAFYPNKQMTTGEGGMMVTDNEEWASLFRSLRNQGRDTFDAWLNHTRLGYNYRMDEMSAALGLAQIKRIEELLTKRDAVAAWYNERIDTIPGIGKPYIVQTTTRMSWFVYVIRCANNPLRNYLIKYLEEHGVPSRPYFTPIHLQLFYQEKFGWKRGDLPHTEKAGDTFLAIPFSGVMREEEVDDVCEQLRAGAQQFSLSFSEDLAGGTQHDVSLCSENEP